MRTLAVSLAASAVPLSLWGCGGGDDTTATPGGGGGGGGGGGDLPSVNTAWTNHFQAFGGADVDRIMKDYDANSKISVYNDECMTTIAVAKPTGLRRFEGLAPIRQFFVDLFDQLNNTQTSVGTPDVASIGPKGNVGAATNGEAQEREATRGEIGDANVFLTWRGNPNGVFDQAIRLATDTFSFRVGTGDQANTMVIDHQTIVTTEPGRSCGAGVDQITPPAADVPLQIGWQNHLDAFGAKNNVTIMDDYNEHSIIQVFNNRDFSYTVYDTMDKIQGFFTQLFADLDAAHDSGATDLQIGVQDVDESKNTVFLVWKSNSHPKATDTFVFAKNSRFIAVQNIVIETPPTAAVMEDIAVVV